MAQVVPPDPLPPDDSVAPLLLGITCTLLLLVLITTALRLHVRIAIHSFGLDDWCITAATLVSVIRVGIQLVQTILYDNGRHRWYISADDYRQNNMLGWVAQLTLFTATALAKTSICCLMLRFKDTSGMRLVLNTAIVGLVATNFACILILLAECSPVDTYWTGRPDGVCWDVRARIYTIYFTIAFGLLTDLMCSLLPLMMMWNVEVPFKTKAKLCSLMSLGLVATGFGAARAASLGLKTIDLSFDYALAAIWSNLELFLTILAANLAIAPTVIKFAREGWNIVECDSGARSRASTVPPIKKRSDIESILERSDTFEERLSREHNANTNDNSNTVEFDEILTDRGDGSGPKKLRIIKMTGGASQTMEFERAPQ